MTQKLVTLDMMKKLGKVTKWQGSSTGLSGRYVDLCSVILPAGYVYEITTYVCQDKSSSESIYNRIVPSNVTGNVYDTASVIKYTNVSVINRAILSADKGVDGTAWLRTYAYDATITYTGYIIVRTIGVV